MSTNYDGSSQYSHGGTPIAGVTTGTIAMAVICRHEQSDKVMMPLIMQKDASNFNNCYLMQLNNANGNKHRFLTNGQTSNVDAKTSTILTTATVNDWIALVGYRWNESSTRKARVYVYNFQDDSSEESAVASGAGGASRDPSGMTKMYVAAFNSATPAIENHFDGDIAEAVVWDFGVTSAQPWTKAQLDAHFGSRRSLSLLSPQSQVSARRFYGTYHPDWRFGDAGTDVGSPVKSALPSELIHFRARRRPMGLALTVAGGGTVPPLHYHHRHHNRAG